MRILVTGSREWSIEHTIRVFLFEALGMSPDRTAIVVHGGAKGADTMASKVCQENPEHFTEEIHLPDYNMFSGRVAPHKRNAKMVALGADVCLAFIRDNSSGSSSTAEKAYKAGIPTYEVHYDTKAHLVTVYYRSLKENIDGKRD